MFRSAGRPTIQCQELWRGGPSPGAARSMTPRPRNPHLTQTRLCVTILETNLHYTVHARRAYTMGEQMYKQNWRDSQMWLGSMYLN